MRISYAPIALLMSITMTHLVKTEEVDLRPYEIQRISQQGEDGILEKIFQLIGTTNKYYVEFGAGNGHYCSNTKWLKEKYGWTGLLLDGACSNKMDDDLKINLHKEFITAENICDIFKKYNVPSEFDLISIDIDNNDFYVWKALTKEYKPRVVVIEFNSLFKPDEDKVVRYEADRSELDIHFGSSIKALFNLGRALGYSLVYEESRGINLFFIRDDAIESSNITFKDINDVHALYKPLPDPVCLNPKIVAQKFISSQEALK